MRRQTVCYAAATGFAVLAQPMRWYKQDEDLAKMQLSKAMHLPAAQTRLSFSYRAARR